jgi:hypothetical protein
LEQEEDVEEAYGSSMALLQEPYKAWVALGLVWETRSLENDDMGYTSLGD